MPPSLDIDYNVLFIVAGWMEAVAYGFLFCMFCTTLYFTFGGARRANDNHAKVLLGLSTAMFLVATLHTCLTCYRLVVAYVHNRTNPRGGPAGYMGLLGRWDSILSDSLYALQEVLGGGAATYRCWVLWNKSYKIIALPSLLVIVGIIFGSWTGALFTKPGTVEGNIDSLLQLRTWIRTMYTVAVVQNILTTGLMIFAIYRNYRNTVGANLRVLGGVRMTWLMRTMVEAAALQLFFEIVLLILFQIGTNVQYIFLFTILPIIAITFNAMTISYRMRQLTERPGGDSLWSFKAAQQSGIPSTRSQPTHIGVDVDVIELSDSGAAYGNGKETLNEV